jgi:hypothetical protein
LTSWRTVFLSSFRPRFDHVSPVLPRCADFRSIWNPRSPRDTLDDTSSAATWVRGRVVELDWLASSDLAGLPESLWS